MTIILAFLIAAAIVAVWAGYQNHTPADFDHFQVDHHENKNGVLTWREK